MEGSTTLETIKVARQFVTFFNYPLNLETDYEDIDCLLYTSPSPRD